MSILTEAERADLIRQQSEMVQQRNTLLEQKNEINHRLLQLDGEVKWIGDVLEDDRRHRVLADRASGRWP